VNPACEIDTAVPELFAELTQQIAEYETLQATCRGSDQLSKPFHPTDSPPTSNTSVTIVCKTRKFNLCPAEVNFFKTQLLPVKDLLSETFLEGQSFINEAAVDKIVTVFTPQS